MEKSIGQAKEIMRVDMDSARDKKIEAAGYRF